MAAARGAQGAQVVVIEGGGPGAVPARDTLSDTINKCAKEVWSLPGILSFEQKRLYEEIVKEATPQRRLTRLWEELVVPITLDGCDDPDFVGVAERIEVLFRAHGEEDARAVDERAVAAESLRMHQAASDRVRHACEVMQEGVAELVDGVAARHQERTAAAGVAAAEAFQRTAGLGEALASVADAADGVAVSLDGSLEHARALLERSKRS